MSTAEEGGAAGNATTSSYGGGGAGGKFRKKPLRQQAKPYDRPPPSLLVNRTNSNDTSSLLTKLVLRPASKLISLGADRFFGWKGRRSLPPPPPPPPQPPETNAQECDRDQGNGVGNQGGEQEPGSGQYSQPINNSSGNGITELEHLLKQKTFSRSEIAHLAELLQSRAADVSPGDACRINVVSALDSGRKKEFIVSQGNRNDRIRSSPVSENDIASPAELAKAYMGSRPSQVSPSALGVRNQLGKERMGLLADTPLVLKSPSTSLAKRTSISLGAAERGFITPRSRGRSAIYTMARTPYSRVHPTSILKGSGISSNGYAGPSTSSTFSPLENDGNFDSMPGTLKRRSSVLDDEIGSVGPIRRIRQKPNLLVSRFHHSTPGVGIGSHAKQKHQLNGEDSNNFLKNSGKNNECGLNTSYGHVPSKSKEVAAKILQQLEKISPKEKSSKSKLSATQDKSSSKPMSSLLSVQALPSIEDVGSSKLLLSFQDDHKSVNKTNATLPDVQESSPQNLVSLDASTSGLGAADSVVENGASQPQKKRAFRMSAGEVPLELDDVECNGLISRPFSKNKGLLEFSNTKSAGESKNTLQSEAKSFPGLAPTSTSEHWSGAVAFGKETSACPASEHEAAQPSSVHAFNKPKESSSPHFFRFNSEAAHKFPSLPSESTEKAASEPERSSSLVNNPISIGFEVRTPGSETGFHIKPVKAVDINGKCDDISSGTLNGSIASNCSTVSFPTASCSDNHWSSTSSAPLFTSSTSIINSVTTVSSTSTAAPSSGSNFGWPVSSSSLGAPVFKFGSSADLPTSAPKVPKASILEREDQKALNPSSGSLTSLFSNFATAANSSGNHFGSSFSNSTGNSLQSSMFPSASKFSVFGAGAISQGTSVASGSSASVPALAMNKGASLGSLPTTSMNFGFSSASTSSSDITSLAPAAGPTSSLFKSSATPSSVSEGPSAGSSTSATPSTFIFGGASVSSSVINTASAFNTSPGMFSFGGSSSSSFTTNMVSPSWPSQKSPISGSPSSGFAFSASTNAAAPPMSFNSSTGASSGPVFSFSSASASAVSTPSLPNSQPLFGVTPFGGACTASPGNNDQMNAEDSMAEDPVPSSAPVPHVFGQPSVSPSPPAFAFGSAGPSQNNPFMFNGQQNQVPLQNPSSPFPATGSLEFNAGGSFSLGSTGGDKSGRKMVKISRSKNRKK